MPLDTYLAQLQRQWQEKVRDRSPWTCQFFADEEIRYAFRMRYQGNTLRVWFAKEEIDAAGIRPLAEAAHVKDKWVTHDAEVMTYPPMSEELARDSVHQVLAKAKSCDRNPNPEIPGGYIALIAQDNNQVQ
jgi:hypothetical protein